MPLVTVADVAAHLNWSASDTSKYTGEMQHFIDGITPVVESITGPVNSATFDEWYDGGYPIILVLHPPILTIQTVTEAFGANTVRTLTEQPLDGVSAVNAYGYTFDPSTGEITRRVSGWASPFTRGRRNIRVQYTAGRATVPENIRLGTLDLIRSTWVASQQVGPQHGFNPSAGDAAPSDGAWVRGFFVPNWVMEQLAPSQHNFGIA